MKLSASIAGAQAQLVADALAAGSLRIYNGTQPASPETALTDQVLLAECALPSPAGTVTSNTLTFAPIPDDPSANATGTPTWARLSTSTNTAIADLTIGQSSGDLQGMTNITAGQRVVVDSLTYVVPLGT